MSHVIAKLSSLLITLISFRDLSVFTLRVLFVVYEQCLGVLFSAFPVAMVYQGFDQ